MGFDSVLSCGDFDCVYSMEEGYRVCILMAFSTVWYGMDGGVPRCFALISTFLTCLNTGIAWWYEGFHGSYWLYNFPIALASAYYFFTHVLAVVTS